ncbi:MAG: YHS domain-containing protein [Alphaproteobacteria bacterium]|nr:YHS domain-containing protein [Alphaproteobacteria bacterium]
MRIKLLLASLAVAAMAPAAEAKEDPFYTSVLSNVAVGGYDAVAYFTQGKAVKGSANFSTSYKGAEFRFANAADLAAFKANPDKYAPQYGGYCAWAVSQGYTASGDPLVWKVVGGKLYLNYNEEIGQRWSKNIPGFIAAADKNWPAVLDK